MANFQAIDLFEHTVTINLDRRPDRWFALQDMWTIAGVSLQRVSAIDGMSVTEEVVEGYRSRKPQDGMFGLPQEERALRGQIGCLESHIAVMARAMREGWPYVCVIEDDAAVHPTLLSWVQIHSQQIPDDWQAIRLGGMLMADYPFDQVTEAVRRVYRVLCTTATIYREASYGYVLDALEKRDSPVDESLVRFDRLGYTYAILPFPCIQAKSGSDIGNRNSQNWSKQYSLFEGPVTWKKQLQYRDLRDL